MKTETQNADAGINIVKVDSCPSLTGKSTLTYHIGCNADEIQIRVHANTGGGYFSKEWIAFSVIQETLAKQTKPFSSMLLKPLFNGKSSNTPAFLLAAFFCLEGEKIAQPKSYAFVGGVEHAVLKSACLKCYLRSPVLFEAYVLCTRFS